MPRFLTAAFAALILLSACGGDDNAPDTSTPGDSTPAGNTLSALEQSLSSIILQPAELPEGMEGGAPDFATNEDLARGDAEALQRLIDVGRQLGVDVQFIPTDRLDNQVPLRGLQSSASVYTRVDGASQTFSETATEARAIDWAAGYPELEDLQVIEVDQPIADESLWLRVHGQLGCTFIVTPTPDEQGIVPTQVCEDTVLFIVDEVIFRSGRTRAYLKVTTLFPPAAPGDSSYVNQIKAWADVVAQRAAAAFPS